MPPWERLKPFVVVGAVGAVVAGWMLVFETGTEDAEWSAEWKPPDTLRGKAVAIKTRDVETTAEREKRLATKHKELRDEVGNVKKSILGDRKVTRGDDVLPDAPELGADVEYSPREACMQMKLEYPERYGDVDCMSDKYDSSEVWWKLGPHGE